MLVALTAIAPIAGLTALALSSTTAIIRGHASAWLLAPAVALALWTIWSWTVPLLPAIALGLALGVTTCVVALRPAELGLARISLLVAVPAVLAAALAPTTFVAIAIVASAGVALRFVVRTLHSRKGTIAFVMLVLAPAALSASRVPIAHIADNLPLDGVLTPDWAWQWHLQEAATGIHLIVVAAALWLLLQSNWRSKASPENA